MLIFCYQYLFQLFLTSLQRFFASILQTLQLVASSNTVSTTGPLQREPEAKDEQPRFLDRHINEVPSKPFALCVFEKVFALLSQPLRAVILGGDRLEEASSRHALSFDGAKSWTRPITNLIPLEEETSTLQRAQALRVRLFHLFTLNREVAIATFSAFRRVKSFHLLKIAHVLAYAGTVLRNLERKDAEKVSRVNNTTSNAAEGTPNPMHPKALTRVSPRPEASTLSEHHFFPVNRSLLGFIEEPKGSPLCAGGFSDVWRCNIRFSTPSEALPTKVALKVLRSVGLSERDDPGVRLGLLKRFEQEAITWSSLPNHPNVVPLVGWTLTPNLSFISPWYDQGSLKVHLKDLSEARKVHILLGVAKGLECLHSCSPPVVHGDLKPENILLSDEGEPLLTDFGLSTILGEERMYTPSHGKEGSAPFMSPEQILGGSRSCQSDVYSFGSLAFTVMTGSFPYPRSSGLQIMFKVCNNKSSNGPVEDWSEYPELQGPIKDLLMECWSQLPNARPSIPTIVQRLTALLESVNLKSYSLSM